MNQTTRTIFVVAGAIVAGAILLLGGMYIGRSTWGLAGFWPGNMMGGAFGPVSSGAVQSPFTYPMGPDMMSAPGLANPNFPNYGFGMMSNGMMSSGMMGGYGTQGNGMMTPGMMGGYGMMGTGMMTAGMMGDFGSGGLLGVAPLSLDDAEQAVQDYLDGLANDDLEIGEIMVFENHAYAQVVEKSTGIGALEVLVDPVTNAVYPEHGPNMMWNVKYSPMSGYGMMGMMGGVGGNFRGMMGGVAGNRLAEERSAEMPASPEEAVSIAQQYLATYLPGAEADEHADPFYGYYTLHVLREGEVVGMLSVNGYTREVFPHTWHGDFVEMAENHAD